MLLNVGSGGGAAPAAGAAAGGAAAGGDAAPEAAKEEEKEEGKPTRPQLSIANMTDNLDREGGIRRRHGFRSLRLNAFQPYLFPAWLANTLRPFRCSFISTKVWTFYGMDIR